LHIEYSQLGSGQCTYRGFFGRRLAKGRNRRLEQEKIDRFMCNIDHVDKVGTNQAFDDKLAYIDASKCNHQVDGNFISGVKIGDIKNQYQNNGGKIWFHMTYTIDMSD